MHACMSIFIPCANMHGDHTIALNNVLGTPNFAVLHANKGVNTHKDLQLATMEYRPYYNLKHYLDVPRHTNSML